MALDNLEISHFINWNNFHKKIKKVGLYPFFKEMHGFVRFRSELPYRIKWISDFKLSRNVKKSTKQLLENCDEEIVIQSGLPKEPGDVDTLFIGYLDKASEVQKKDLLNEALEYAVLHGLNVFSFLPPCNEKKWLSDFNSKGLWLKYPNITYEYALKVFKEVPEKKAFDTPIIGVFGTSSKQGKFTLQLALRYELERRGYKIGQIGTEHQSGCFGIDFTFPSGYGLDKSLQIPMDFHIPLIRRVLSEMDKGQFDVIIVGAQSGLLNPDPYYYGNIYSELFFIGTLPDVTVLICNFDDDEALIASITELIHVRTRNNGKIIVLRKNDFLTEMNKMDNAISKILNNIL